MCVVKQLAPGFDHRFASSFFLLMLFCMRALDVMEVKPTGAAPGYKLVELGYDSLEEEERLQLCEQESKQPACFFLHSAHSGLFEVFASHMSCQTPIACDVCVCMCVRCQLMLRTGTS